MSLGDLGRPPIVADYVKDPQSTLEKFRAAIHKTCEIATKFDALVIAGGSGAVAGFAMNGGLHHLVLAMDRLRKPIVAQCNGVFALVQAIDPRTDASVLRGRLATTHSKSHEYRRGGWGWAKVDEHGQEIWTLPGADGNPIIDSEPMVKNAVGPSGAFISPPVTAYSVAIDDHIITARTTADGAPATAALIAALEQSGLAGRWVVHDDSGFKKF
jgi:putative intracellular protease/amidase